MPSPEDIANQQELLAAYRRTLTQLLKQQALLTQPFTPPAIGHGIDDARDNIRRVKAALRSWGVPVDDLPGDEEPAEPPAAPPRPTTIPRTRRTWAIALVIGLVALGALGALTATLLPGRQTGRTVLQSVFYWSQCDVEPVWVLPGALSPDHDPAKAREQIAAAIASKKIDTWQVAGIDPEGIPNQAKTSGERKLYMTVRGSGTSKIDIHLFNIASVTVTTEPSPQHVDLVTFRTTNLWECPSGGGFNRTFAPTDLTQQVRQYTTDRQYTNEDYLPLSSEQSEVLVFPFQCQSPGTYSIQIGLRYRDNLKSVPGTYRSDDLATIVCPASFTYWPITYSSNEGESSNPEVQLGSPSEYFWNGTSYQEGSQT